MIKKLISLGLVAVTLVVLAGPMATKYGFNSTATIAAATTNNFGADLVFPLGNASTFTLGIGFACNGTNGNVQTILVEKSIDNINWQSLITWVLTANGTTYVWNTTNFTSLACDMAYIRVTSWANINTNTASVPTNIYVVGYQKPAS